MSARQVSGTRTIDAPAQQIFDLLADPAQHPLIDGSGAVRASRAGAGRRLSKGASFGMDMQMKVPYRIRNTVVEFEEGRLIAWRHFMGHRWRWQLSPVDDNTTEVTETFDWSTAHAPIVLELVGFPAANKRAIDRSLDRLQQVVAR